MANPTACKRKQLQFGTPNTRCPRDGAGRVLDVLYTSEVVGNGGSREMIIPAFASYRTRLTSTATIS